MNKSIPNNLLTASRAFLVLAVAYAALMAAPANAPVGSHGKNFTSQRLAPIAAPALRTATAATLSTPATTGANKLLTPRAMKLLVIAGDGTEPGLAALRSFLNQIGIPYDYVLTASTALPPLTGPTGNGNYQGIILTTGNAEYSSDGGATFVSGLSNSFNPGGYAALDAYTYNFGVRTVSYYNASDARYGLSNPGFTSVLPTDS